MMLKAQDHHDHVAPDGDDGLAGEGRHRKDRVPPAGPAGGSPWPPARGLGRKAAPRSF